MGRPNRTELTLAEREITTGDSIYVAIVQTGKKVEIKQVPMRED